jgi:hypothetical protein
MDKCDNCGSNHPEVKAYHCECYGCLPFDRKLFPDCLRFMERQMINRGTVKPVHEHRATRDSMSTDPRPFTHCVAGEDCNPRAHGWGSGTETCKCGVTRAFNFNQGFCEYGPWSA